MKRIMKKNNFKKRGFAFVLAILTFITSFDMNWALLTAKAEGETLMTYTATLDGSVTNPGVISSYEDKSVDTYEGVLDDLTNNIDNGLSIAAIYTADSMAAGTYEYPRVINYRYIVHNGETITRKKK